MLEQSPAAFTTQPQGTTVVITVSTFEKPTPTPTPDADADAHAETPTSRRPRPDVADRWPSRRQPSVP